MSGHRKFSELTKKFTPEDWRKVEKIQDEILVAIARVASKAKQG